MTNPSPGGVSPKKGPRPKRAAPGDCRRQPSKHVAKAELRVAARVVLADDPAEVRVRRIRDREAGRRRRPRDVVPVGTIDKVEDLGAELQPLRAVDAEVLEERDVPLLLGGVVPC